MSKTQITSCFSFLAALLLFCGYPKPKEEFLTYLSEVRLKGYPNALSLLPNGNYLFVASGQVGIEVIDLSDLSNPRKVKEYSDNSNTSWDLKVSDSLCFLAYGKKELEILKFSLPETIFPIGVNEYSVAYGYSLAFDSLRKLVYMAAREQFITFDVSHPNYPSDLKKEDFPSARGIFFDGEYLYLACEQLGVFIYQATDSFPVRVGLFDSSFNARDCWVKDSLLFIADGRALTIANIKDKTKPRVLVSLPVSGYAQKVSGFGDYLFLSAGEGGLYLYDISSFPPRELERIDLSYVRCSLYQPEKKCLLVGERDRGVLIYELK